MIGRISPRNAAIAGAVAVLAALAGAFLAMTVGGGDGAAGGERRGEETAFYTEVTATVVDLDGPRALVDGITSGDHVTRVGWWSADARHWRTEIELVEPALESGMLVNVADGTQIWSHQQGSGTYVRYPLPDGGAGSALPLMGVSALIGPAGAATIEEIADEFRTRGAEVTVSEPDTGSALRVIEYGPLWHGSSSEVGPSATATETTTETSGGVGRMTVDTEHMWIVRHELAGGAGHQSALLEVTNVRRGEHIDDRQFRFDLPAGASELSADGSTGCSSGGGSLGGPGITAPPGMLRPTYISPGYTTVASGSSGASGGGCDEVGAWALLRFEGGDDAPFLLFEQRRRVDGIPAPLTAGTRSDVSGGEGYRFEADGVRRLTWRDGDLVAVLESDALSFDELARMAGSATIVAESGGGGARR